MMLFYNFYSNKITTMFIYIYIYMYYQEFIMLLIDSHNDRLWHQSLRINTINSNHQVSKNVYIYIAAHA